VSAALRILGLPGLTGIALLVAALALWHIEVAPRNARIQALEQRLARLPQARPLSAAAAPHAPPIDAAARLQTYYAFFQTGGTTDALATLHAIGRALDLVPARADYRFERLPDVPLSVYSVTLSVAGQYPAIRRYVDHALEQLPQASLDAVRFERRSRDQLIEARLDLSLFVLEP